MNITIDKSCVFAVCNQHGKMLDKRGKQKHCMIIQNVCFEQKQTVTTAHNFISTEEWAEYGYEDVISIPKHSCMGCKFYKSKEEFKLVPSNLPVRYAWTVERRAKDGI